MSIPVEEILKDIKQEFKILLTEKAGPIENSQIFLDILEEAIQRAIIAHLDVY